MSTAQRPSIEITGKQNVNPSINRITEATAEDFQELGQILIDHANRIDANVRSEELADFYGFKTSLALFAASYPDAPDNSWGVIDPGNGNPQTIAKVVGGVWTATVNQAPIQRYTTKSAIPDPAQENIWYVTTDSKLLHLWYNNQLNTFGKDGNNGLDAYEVAVAFGFAGTRGEWLASLVGKDNYQLWLDAGNVGTYEDFFEASRGPEGPPGPPGDGSGETIPVNETFTSILQFNKDKYNNTSHQQSGAIAFSLNTSGHIDGKVIRHKVLSDGQNTITFPAGWNVFNKAENDIYPAGLQVIYFTYMGGDVDVSIPLYDGTVIIPDITAPTFTDVTVEPTGTTTANFNSRINEQGTIFWAVYPTADTAHTKSEVENGTGAAAFGSVATIGGVTEIVSISGLTYNTTYKVHYFARDPKTNETVVALTSAFTLSIIVMQDDFNDNSINTAKWTLFNPTPTKVTITETGGKLSLKAIGSSSSAYYDDRLTSISSIDSGTLAADIFHPSGSINGAFIIEIGTDVNNRLMIANNTSGETMRVFVLRGGATLYSITSGLQNVDGQKVKIFYNRATKTTTFYYYSSGWVQMGTYTDTVEMPTGMKVTIVRANGIGTNEYNVDNLYLTNANYTTITP